MLFNSPEFLFLFLPTAILGYYLAQRINANAPIWWLLFCSLFFYGYWDVRFLPVLLFSILANYAVSQIILRSRNWKRVLLTIGIAFNLALLGYFKYANFFVETVEAVSDRNFHWNEIVLPIGISFFTFQAIAFLCDVCAGKSEERNFGRFALFISFFPQLLAGPIVHHKEMMPQFGKIDGDRWKDASVGFAVFIAGLVKKLFFADSLAIPASSMFDAAATGSLISTADAWIGTICYSLQIYFDFSGYSDMAIGLGLFFGIKLPINFASPYKATSISDFWRRWHITLSRFLRDYLYVPLGGSRVGTVRHKANLLITMILGGFWHGAEWTFLLWGALHGSYLLIHHVWRSLSIVQTIRALAIWPIFAWSLTMLVVILAWVPFRAADIQTTWVACPYRVVRFQS